MIEGAERILVKLTDGRSLFEQVLGFDPDTDIALIKVPSDGKLPHAVMGDSDDLRVGEWVCAIGNPLAYEHTVTVGVVSFIGRKLFDMSLDNYIQTDAAINFGNSGGPLINTRGEVIGINSAISSRASSIGFAVPINHAVSILPQLKADGRVSRGFIGVTLTDVTPGLQRALGLSVSHGAVVQDVTPRSPAERAGLKAYDVILEVEGQAVLTNQELIRDISGRKPGSIARLEVLREGRRQSLPIKLAERPARGDEFDDPQDGLNAPASPRPPLPDEDVPLGVWVREMDRIFTTKYDIPGSLHGVVVHRVDPAGPATQALRRNLVILEINRKATRSLAEYQQVVNALRAGDVAAVYYYDPTSTRRGLITVTVD